MEEVYENKMGTAPIPTLIWRMSLPMMISMLVLALYNVVDGIFVARVSQDALAALSLAFPFQMLIPAVAVGTGVGVNSLAARRLGAKDQAGADEAASHGQVLALLSGFVLALLFAFFARPMIGLFTDEAAILLPGGDYLWVCGTFCPFVLLQVMNEKTLQATGNMVHPMLIQLVGAVFNIVLDPILIFGLLGFPAMGAKGAAIATVAGQFVGMLLSFYYLYGRSRLIAIRLRGFRFKRETLKLIYTVAVPNAVMQAIGSLCNFGLNAILIAFTPVAVSVLGVYFKLQSFVFMPVFGLNSGTMPIMAFNYGARNKTRLLQAVRCGCLYACIIMLLGMAVFQFFPEALLSLFDPSAEMLLIGVKALRTLSLCFPVAAICIMFGAVFSALGLGTYSLVIALCRQLVVILPAAFILSRVSGLQAVWYAYPIAEAVSLTLSVFFFLRTYRQKILPLGELAPVS